MNRQVALFELGRRIVSDHSNSDPGTLSVLSVVVDNVDDVLPVLEAAARVCEGRLLSTHDPSLRVAIDVTQDPVRRTAVETAFGAEGPRQIRMSFSNDQADVSFRDVPSGGTSVGQETVLALVRALIHRDLDDHSLVIVTFPESLIDYQFRGEFWRLINDHLREMPSATLRTLVIVAESAIDIEMHCGTGTGFRFALQGRRLLTRQGSEDLAVSARFVANYEKPLVLFLGAGFAASSRMPLGNRMRDEAIRRLLDIGIDEPMTSDELGERFRRWVFDRGWAIPTEQEISREEYVAHLTLEQVIRAERALYDVSPTLTSFRDHHDRVLSTPGQAVKDLCQLLSSSRHRPVLVETNFDLLIETHCSAALRVFSSDSDFNDATDYLDAYLAAEEDEIPLLKIHGTIDSPETCVISTAQTEVGVGQAKLEALRHLRHIEAPILWIYVGTSMRDLDLRGVLRDEDFARGVDEQWVEPYLSQGVEDFGRDRAPFWKKTERQTIQDRLISETADAFFAAVRKAMDD